MATPLRVLVIEDNEDDAALLLRELQRGGYAPDWRRVDTAPALLAALRAGEWDVITCDWVMPDLGALGALRLLREQGVTAPVIIVSGQVGEEVAVAAMKAGAHDYVSKHRLTRLVPAIERELAESRGRRRTETTLQESEARYRALVESLHDVVFEIGADERISYVSPSIVSFDGATAADYLGRPFREVAHPDDLPAVLNSLQRTLGGTHEPLIFRIVGPRGRAHWVRTSSRPIFDGNGAFRALRGVMTDVTEQVEAELAYQTVFEHSLQGLAVVQDDRIVLVNPALAELTGYPVEVLRGASVLTLTAALVHPDDAARMQAAAREYLEGRARSRGFEFRITRLDGQVRRVITAHTDIPYRGRPARLVAYIDVTERWQAEEAYAAIFEGAIHGMVLVQGDRIVMANPAVAEITGRPQPMAGQPLHEMIAGRIHPDDLDDLRTHLDRWLALGQVPSRYALRVRASDGTDRLLYTQTVLVTHDGAPAALVMVADLTGRWRAEEAYRAVFERALEGLLVVSGPHVLMANQAAAELTGYGVDELTRTPTPDLLVHLIHPDDQPALQAELASSLNGATQFRRHALRLRRRDGAERRVLTACTPMTFAGRPAVLFSVLDVGDR